MQLRSLGLRFVDVGCSGALPSRWSPLTDLIDYVGFDPSPGAAERVAASGAGFRSLRILPHAVAGRPGRQTLVSTRSPHCSSLLEPRHAWLDRFVYRDLFEERGRSEVPCTTLDESRKVDGIGADVLKIDGFEVMGAYRFRNGFEIGGNYTSIDGESEIGGPADSPTGETYSDKAAAYLRYTPMSGRYWLEYRVRHNGEQDTLLDPGAVVGPIGPVIPSFTVHALGAGYRIWESQRSSHTLGVTVENATDELYAEFSNASFFRPQPNRNFVFSYRLRLR